MTNLAIAVVIENGRALVQHRFRESKNMVFEFPGGSIDNNEFPVQAAIRELREETGVRGLVAVNTYTYKNAFGGNIHFVILEENKNRKIQPMVVDPERQQTFIGLQQKKYRCMIFTMRTLNS